jgi:hypothetical protein
MARTPPGNIRDSIVGYLSALSGEASVTEISQAVAMQLGLAVSPSSIRSYLNLNVGEVFERAGRGRYRLKGEAVPDGPTSENGGLAAPAAVEGSAELYHADCFDWLAAREPASVHAVVTDPPYGLLEYSEKEQAKLRNGRGGVWRIPPSFDGHRRSPLPRFTVLGNGDLRELHAFFKRLGLLLARVTVPGANIIVASNPLLSHIVANAMCEAGLELRGTIVRLTMTMRGGDRPKNAHHEFDGVSVMPRSMWEPWVALRRPLGWPGAGQPAPMEDRGLPAPLGRQALRRRDPLAADPRGRAGDRAAPIAQAAVLPAPLGPRCAAAGGGRGARPVRGRGLDPRGRKRPRLP